MAAARPALLRPHQYMTCLTLSVPCRWLQVCAWGWEQAAALSMRRRSMPAELFTALWSATDASAGSCYPQVRLVTYFRVSLWCLVAYCLAGFSMWTMPCRCCPRDLLAAPAGSVLKVGQGGGEQWGKGSKGVERAGWEGAPAGRCYPQVCLEYVEG